MTVTGHRIIRAFRPTEEDYQALSVSQRLVYPEYPFSPAEMRHEDETWDHKKFFMRRWVLEADGEIVGWAQVHHSRHSFVADTYWSDLEVVPAARRRGHGTALYEQILDTVRQRAGRRLRSGTKESMSEGVAFLLARGFTESKRDWESRLPLRDFAFGRFAGARERVEREGIRISTLRDELTRDPDAARKAFDLNEEVHWDVPSSDPPTPGNFDTWRKRALEGPNALLEAYFLAVDKDGRYVGVSELERSAEDPTFLWQGITGTARAARGKGIAMALKLETVRYAKERGFDHIKTWNDQRNRRMLSINEALGFVKQPAWIQFAKDL
ncbi:MAG: GNAT family N-acetyltransferase [Chloroflexi bacterium]|nr:GNAT family N-acetyltransferase [Chloroflexota bacterium]